MLTFLVLIFYFFGHTDDMKCNWEDRDFYKEDGKWVLTQVDSTDNCFEEKARKAYWEKR